MLWRFCLYGFFKNQRYFEPFIVLAFMARGYSFFLIGLILGFRELCCNLMEIPSGAVADVLGRRRSMIVSHVMYLVAFMLMASLKAAGWMFFAMFFFSIGEVFRTGTHKALIFRWLRLNGREDEKTKIYGLTRSWSKIGSALSAIIATAMLLIVGDYDIIFWLSAIPMSLNIVNFLGYDKNLDRDITAGGQTFTQVLRTLRLSLVKCFADKPLRNLLAESMCFEGLFRSSASFLQPVLLAAALAIPILLQMNDDNRGYIMIGAIYTVTAILSSFASRFADKFHRLAGTEDAAASRMWYIYLGVFASVLAYSIWAESAFAIAAFIVLNIVQNFWRPILISRIASHSGDRMMATILSVESQSKTLFASAMLPIIGFLMDTVSPGWKFVPLGLICFSVVVLVILLRNFRVRQPEQSLR